MKSKATLFPAWTIYGLVLAIPGLSFAAVATAASNFTDANWSSMGGFPGANGPVYTGAVDGSGNLYISGPFTLVCDVVADGIAKWDGTSWSGLGTKDTYVEALAVNGTDLYVAGTIRTPGGFDASFARWDGADWSALPEPGFSVSALTASETNLYAGGESGYWRNGDAVAHVAKWNGTNWIELASWDAGNSLLNRSYVLSLTVSGNDLYIGGIFTNVSGVAATNIARWNGRAWSAVGSGLQSDRFGGVEALTMFDGNLYAGGSFATTDDASVKNIAKWNGKNWSAVGSGIRGSVWQLEVSGNNLYAGGMATNNDGIAVNYVYYIAKWDRTNWTVFESATNRSVELFAGAGAVYESFTTASGNADRIARWNGNEWVTVGPRRLGVFGQVWSVAASGSSVFAGGDISNAEGIAANGVAKWDGSSWDTLGSGLKGRVFALAASVGGELFAGGDFAASGDAPATNIARWNGTTWSALGTGFDRDVRALAASGTDLYAGGYFTMAGGKPARHVAKWDGNNWSALGSGFSGDAFFEACVFALAVSGNNLYAGGYLRKAGNLAVNYVAQWNGRDWSALGSGLNAVATAFAVSGGDLYVGGQFTKAGGLAANSIAKWDGSSWSPLGAGLAGEVWALAISSRYVYAAGSFTEQRGAAGNSIVRWDGVNWTPLGSGISGTVRALAIAGSDLYVGGAFQSAGGKVSAFMARAYLQDLPALSALRSGVDMMVSWPSVDTAGFTLEQSGHTLKSWGPNSGIITDDGTKKSVMLPASTNAQFFRLRRP